jgi:hypothetical protein
MDIKALAKAAGLSDIDLKGKSLDEQIRLITRKMNEEKEALEIESAREFIENYKNEVPKLINLMGRPFDIYVKKVGQRRTPVNVRVAGYNSNDKKLIVLFGNKLYQIEDDDLIKSISDLESSKTAKRPSPRKPKPGK